MSRGQAVEPEGRALKVLAASRALVIAHRGLSAEAPENTLPAFKLALASGADLVELDYRHSHDGQLMVIHDRTLDRTTDARAHWRGRRFRVDTKTAAEIQSLDAGSWCNVKYAGTQVPLLSEALDLISQSSVPLIERKAGEPSACVALLRGKNLLNQVVVQSFDWAYLRRFHELEPEQVLAALGPASLLPNGKKPFGISRRLTKPWLKQFEKTGAKVVVWSRKLSKRSVRLAHERGFKVWVYTIDNVRLAKRLLSVGVDGIITNQPALIAGVVDARRASLAS